MNALSRFYQFVFRSPMFWGTLGAVAFYGLIEAGPLDHPLVRRYFAHHPVEYMETVIFAVGLAVLVLKAIDLVSQYLHLGNPLLAGAAAEGSVKTQAAALLKNLDDLPAVQQDEAYPRRLRNALEFLHKRGSAEGLDDELKYMADSEATRVHNSYGLFRVIVWAIPILGFLGTVIGITVALNGVDLNAPDKSMVDVLTGLGLKFDTTALALSLSMVLMFLHFFVDRAETALSDQVTERVAKDLAERFPSVPAGPDGQLLIVRRMAETVVEATEQLVARQAALWQQSMDAAAARWTELAESAGARLQTALSAALGESLKQAQVETVGAMAALQDTVERQIELLEKTVRATGEVTALEESLNHNLATLAGAKHFEQTVTSLAAAVNLLSARLADVPPAATVKLEPSRKAARAA